MWDGRFSKATKKDVNDFNSSLSFDSRMYAQDIKGSMAHCKMLCRQGILTAQEEESILLGLTGIESDIKNGVLPFDFEAEDIHMFIEGELTKRIGDAGKKLHTGRSRNDQVALDLRLYLIDECKIIRSGILSLYRALLTKAKTHTDTVMPGYTHLQRAQPITFAHHLSSYLSMLERDIERLEDTVKRMDCSPLGSGALAGTTYPLDRSYTADLLGLSGITKNSMDGVSDRDFCIELASMLSIFMMHLSRLCEEIILWSSQEFAFIELDDAYATGSSIMPQKKNPDVAELTRGKTGRVYGNLITLLTVMKGLPLAYNKDMQEDKEAIFDSVDTVKSVLPAFTGMINTMTVKKEIMKKAASGGFTNATDLADYLVLKGIPFRSAHEISGRLVHYCIEKGTDLSSLTLEEMQSVSDRIEQDVYQAIDVLNCVHQRTIPGSPAPETVKSSLQRCEEWLARASK